MKDVVSDIDQWLANGERVALATVVQTWGAAPRSVGAKMALTPDGKIAGSVSGGCVEGAVFEAATEVLENGQAQMLHFGVGDETAWDVGLSCGGTIEVFVQPLDIPAYQQVHRLLDEEQPGATATVIGGPADLLGTEVVSDRSGKLLGSVGGGLDEPLRAAVRNALGKGESQRVELPAMGAKAAPVEVFIEVMAPRPSLVMVGGVHIADALTTMANALGYHTVVIDPRRAFGSEDRFPHADHLLQTWPEEAFPQIELNERTAVAMLTHDPKIDDPALSIVLASPVFYIGALGSAKTQAKRQARLLAAGMSEEQMARIHAPIGLKIGARTPEEIALSIMGQIVAVRRAGGARS